MSFLFKKCFTEYLLFGYEPATSDELKFYSRSLRRKIKLLQQAYAIKEIETDNILTDSGKEIITWGFVCKSLPELEKKAAKTIMNILNEGQPLKGFIYWKAKPKFERYEDKWKVIFRVGVE